MKRRLVLSGLWLLCLLFFIGTAQAEEAADITTKCTIEVSSNPEDVPKMKLMDRSAWRHTGDADVPFMEITTPPDKPAYGLYIVWNGALHPGVILVPDGTEEGWTLSRRYGADGFAHEFIALDGLTRFRIVPSRGAGEDFSVCQLNVLGEGEPPAHVQVWEPPLEQADLMAIAAHPDDELVFLGGVLPTYAGDRGVATQMVYMTCSNNDRRSELLNGLWTCGVRNYPVIGDFIDVYMDSLEIAEMYWSREEANGFLTEQLRRFQPRVVVSLDVQGEYGHGAHMLTAEAALEAVRDLAGNEAYHPASAEAYGVHQVQKLYLHLYPEGNRQVDWRRPLAAFDGRTALEVAEEAFSLHSSQLLSGFAVLDTGDTSCASFGLALTRVGEDQTEDDFMEHIVGRE